MSDWVEAFLKEAATRRDECRRFVREWTSTLGAKGLFKKVFVIFLVALCHGLDTMSPNEMIMLLGLHPYDRAQGFCSFESGR